MKNLISKTVIMLALTSPAMTVLAVTTDLNTNNETINNNSGLKSPGVDENSISTINYLNTEMVADTLTTNTERKGWDGTVKGNSKGINESGIKRTENERKGWDGSVKGNSKGINQAGIKRTENERKGWDGTVKGGNINEERINGTEDPTDSMQQKANINTSRSNIKRALREPPTEDRMQQKANINTSRSNIKSQMKISKDSLQQTEAGGMSNPYYQSNGNAGEMPAQLQRGIDKKDVRRAVRKDADVNETTPVDNLTQKEILNDNDGRATNKPQRKTKHDTAKNSINNVR
jgi:hypothetical protein